MKSTKQSDGWTNRLSLRTILGVTLVACILFAITRPSLPATILAVVAVILALASVFARRIRGEIVVLLVIGVPLLILALRLAINLAATWE